MLQEKIGIIGAGKIGSAIARGMIAAGLVSKDNVMASDVSERPPRDRRGAWHCHDRR